MPKIRNIRIIFDFLRGMPRPLGIPLNTPMVINGDLGKN